jgi:hypothetical protein
MVIGYSSRGEIKLQSSGTMILVNYREYIYLVPAAPGRPYEFLRPMWRGSPMMR